MRPLVKMLMQNQSYPQDLILSMDCVQLLSNPEPYDGKSFIARAKFRCHRDAVVIKSYKLMKTTSIANITGVLKV